MFLSSQTLLVLTGAAMENSIHSALHNIFGIITFHNVCEFAYNDACMISGRVGDPGAMMSRIENRFNIMSVSSFSSIVRKTFKVFCSRQSSLPSVGFTIRLLEYVHLKIDGWERNIEYITGAAINKMAQWRPLRPVPQLRPHCMQILGEEQSTSSSHVLTLSIDVNRASTMRALMT